jgi:tetratricopeptide (TPR) repeat protein
VLVLIDIWPGGRLPVAAERPLVSSLRPLGRLVLEKAPLFALAAASAGVTYVAQQAGGAVHGLGTLPFPLRLANALVSYVAYLVKTLWPTGLSIFYPHPVHVPGWHAVGSGLIVLGLSTLAVRTLRRHPAVFTGWFWYVGMLVPVIGLVKVGEQARADRYTYLPLVGVFLVVSWLGAEALRGRERLASVVAGATIAACAMAASAQVSRWRDSETLFTHTLAVTQGNALVHNNLGIVLAERGRAAEARAQFSEAVRVDPRYPDARGNLGLALLEARETEAALVHLREAVRLQPGSAVHRHNLGLALAHMGDDEAAIAELAEAVRLRPRYGEARSNLGALLDRVGRSAEGEAHLREAVRLRPGAADSENNLGLAIARQGRFEEAIGHFRRALALQPGHGPAQRNLERAEAALAAQRGAAAKAR